MLITAQTNKLSKILNDSRKIQEYFGKARGRRIKERLDEFDSVPNLSYVSYLPPARCHQLKPHNKCQFAVDVSKNFRMVFEGYDSLRQLTRNPKEIVIVQIIKIEDYH